jgi:hypothetical protein
MINPWKQTVNCTDALSTTLGRIGGYPRNSTFGIVVGSREPSGRDEYVRYHSSAIVVSKSSYAIQRLETMARNLELFVVIGVIEKDVDGSGSLYCTALFIDPVSGLVAKHRKLQPTGAERFIWAQGDATTLPVVQHTFSQATPSSSASTDSEEKGVTARLSACICWESYMVTRHSLIARFAFILTPQKASTQNILLQTTHSALVRAHRRLASAVAVDNDAHRPRRPLLRPRRLPVRSAEGLPCGPRFAARPDRAGPRDGRDCWWKRYHFAPWRSLGWPA